ncbi:ATP-dependent metallopeptidase FtsH/Yme1/Tma family protein [Candidatus Poribacteria bacterium]|nr:ATP-dependent metallopeptidase FtsH/Yme1/Tma family protein [Candidatus Poribacteria bacterium]
MVRRSHTGIGRKSPVGKNPRSLTVWIIVLLVLVFASYWHWTNGAGNNSSESSITYSQLLTEIERNRGTIEKVVIGPEAIRVEYANRQIARINKLPSSQYPLEEKLQSVGIPFEYEAAPKFQWLSIVATSVLPLLFFIGLIVFMSRQMQGTGNRALSFGKSRARIYSEGQPKRTFADVAGCEEAKESLEEIIEFLREPKKFQRLGGRIPKGVLLVGPPGTGKTLLARAVAGEAGVPFFSISGSDFVEMFVGVGAARVRDLFEQGKKNAPCIIFIDELDAVGRHRGAGIGGGHDEREQTLNQLLVEMDGFDSSGGVILIAATNRPDVLDPALLRAGRFDRQVIVDLPDIAGREAILRVHAKNKPLADDVDLARLSKGTPFFSGADLENVVNEAALLAAKQNLDKITMATLEEAKDRVMMGPERRSLVISEEERRVTAYHEAGHAVVAHYLPEGDPNYKVSIIPRGRALGITVKLPIAERHNYTKSYLLADIATRLAGRVAEELVFNEATTGAKNDFETATNTARRMVCEWGMSEKLGPLTFGKREEQIFLGRELATHRDYSEQTAIVIDDEVREIIDKCWATATDILRHHSDKLHELAEMLLARESLDGPELEALLGPRQASLQPAS